MSAFAARIPAAFAQLGRRRDGRLVAGVCAGLAHTARVDATLVRLVFALLALAGGAGVLAYAGAWLALPLEGGPPPDRARRAGGVLLLGSGAVLALRALGVADSVVWPAAIVGAGVFLAARRPAAGVGARAGRDVLAIALILGGVALFVSASGDRQWAGAPAGLLAALSLVVGPWVWRLARERDAERVERIRAQERADVAARVHDSVLQTLALVQRSADDPKRVAALARRQERELRAWLYGGDTPPGETLRRALDDALADVEELHGVRVELVMTGDRPLDVPLRALVLAAREAVTNAAAHAHVADVAVFADVGEHDVGIFVRDRGRGFDRAAVPADRRGIARSIEDRLTRHGGTVRIRTAPGDGTEVELRLPVAGP